MKFQHFFALLTAATAAADMVFDQTDHLMFDILLPDFVTHRDQRIPSWLDWWSDGCTDAPDNPFGFRYTPACWRHDFGYDNFRQQRRFTKDNKGRIDINFRDDMMYICDNNGKARGPCKTLARLYYFAVSKFGGKDATNAPGRVIPRAIAGQALVDRFDELAGEYADEVQKAQASGELPTLEHDIKASLEPLRRKMVQAGAHVSLEDVYS
ncbi:hypothetical protein E4U55_006415 [Claviceps digitariae]|nr:hypothetical protein E4U55_006415 [Claviceps digitariae]